VDRSGLELVIRCVSFGFEPITKVQHGPISLKRPASESTEDQANTYRFAGVTDGVADSNPLGLQQSSGAFCEG
jgi:hypothetical protein